jgi:hypothetical protein
MMKNRDMPAKPIFNADGFPTHNSHVDENNCNGLTKLEYAAIHIHAAQLERNQYATASSSITEAHDLFDELEKQRGDE